MFFLLNMGLSLPLKVVFKSDQLSDKTAHFFLLSIFRFFFLLTEEIHNIFPRSWAVSLPGRMELGD